MTNFSPNELRRAFGRFPTGVTVVTTRTADGGNVGFTANSFTSVSMDPPLVLVCLDYRATLHEAFCNACGFVINVLSSEQQHTALQFASRIPDRFEGVAWRPGESGLPVLENSCAHFECALEDIYRAGDHSIFLGRVNAFSDRDTQPLGFHSGKFTQLHPPFSVTQ